MSRNEKLRIGIIGCGLMGGIHAECYDRAKNARLVGFTNRTRDKAEKLAKRFGAKVYDSIDDLLGDRDIDAVSICSSQAVHAEQIIKAAKAGKHILAEKPLALTTDEMDAIEKAVNDAGITFMVAHQMRFHPVIRAVRDGMKKLGRCYHLDLEWCFRITAHQGRCWEDYRSGGFFMELGVHAADLARFFMGPIRNISGHTVRMNPKRVTEDYTLCILQFESNAVASVLVSANHRTTRQGLLRGRVLGEKGRIEFTVYPYQRSMNAATMIVDKGKSIFVPDEVRKPLKWKATESLTKTYPGFFDIYQREVEAFLDAVRNNSTPPVTLADGRSAVEVVLAVYDAQGQANARPNFVNRAAQYASDASCHPMLEGVTR